MVSLTHLTKEVKVWIKSNKGKNEIVRVVPDFDDDPKVYRYFLYYAFSENNDAIGCILFDKQGYWIYDGDILSVPEQEKVAEFIMNYRESL